jgi:hypothetical protein
MEPWRDVMGASLYGCPRKSSIAAWGHAPRFGGQPNPVGGKPRRSALRPPCSPRDPARAQLPDAGLLLRIYNCDVETAHAKNVDYAFSGSGTVGNLSMEAEMCCCCCCCKQTVTGQSAGIAPGATVSAGAPAGGPVTSPAGEGTPMMKASGALIKAMLGTEVRPSVGADELPKTVGALGSHFGAIAQALDQYSSDLTAQQKGVADYHKVADGEAKNAAKDVAARLKTQLDGVKAMQDAVVRMIGVGLVHGQSAQAAGLQAVFEKILNPVEPPH